MIKSHKAKITILILLALMITTTGFRCKFISPSEKQLLQSITLNWWGTFDESSDFATIIADYKAIHPNITINYRQLRPEEFEKTLLEALAEDRGPDIISLHNTWVTKYLNKLEPLPETTKMAYQTTQKSLGIKEETIIEVRENQSITTRQLKESFLDTVYNDVVKNNQIYGLPVAVNTLVLFYNRDLFNNAGIALPPADWQSLQENVKRLTFQDQEGNLIQAGVALGLADNVENSSDILALLMMQNGSVMTTGNNATFNVIPPGGSKEYNPGPEAVRFFTDFANPTKEVYSWNDKFSNSVDAFAQGKVAMIFGYGYFTDFFEATRGGKLNYGIAKVPQIEGRPEEVNFASYWVQTVSKKSKYINEAWDFIQFLAQKKQAKKYLDKTGYGTALRSLIEDQTNNDATRIFAEQLLTSKSWYRGNDSQVIDLSFKEMIDMVRSGGNLQKAVDLAAGKVSQTL